MSVDGQRPPALAVVFGAPSMGDDSEVGVFCGPGPHRRHIASSANSAARMVGGAAPRWRAGVEVVLEYRVEPHAAKLGQGLEARHTRLAPLAAPLGESGRLIVQIIAGQGGL